MSQLSKRQKQTGFLLLMLLALAALPFVTRHEGSSPIVADFLPGEPVGPMRIADPFDEDDLQLLKQNVAQLQTQAVGELEAGHLTRADLAMQEADALIHKALGRSPDDVEVLQQEGCLHRNIAAAYQRVAMNNQVERNLSEAEHAFRLIVSFDSDNANAWKSLGDIYTLRQEFDRAEQCVRRAIELDPEHQAAKDDLDWILAQQQTN